MNAADSRHAAARLESAGYAPVSRAEDADVVILNTCVVRQQAEDKIYGKLNALRALKNKRPDTCIALMGCLVGMRPRQELKDRFPWVDVFLPPSDFEPLARHLFGESRDPADEEFRLPEHQINAVTAHVPAVLGCSCACTYCIIPYRRGREHSRPMEDILREVRALTRQGVREVVLLGQIVDRYGLDLGDGGGLAGLLRALARESDLLRIRFLTSHPNYIADDIIRAVAEEPKVCPHFEMPFQAGNDEVLARMKRGYTAAQYRERVRRIRDLLPDAAIHTDIITGFPGETHEQFMDSYRLLDELQLDKAHIARYSPRPQTYAARRFEDDVPDAEKEERRRLLDERQTDILREKNRRMEGAVVEVLVDGRDERRGRWRGRTVTDKIVYFPSDRRLLGQLVRVRITESSPFSLLGTPAEAYPA